MAELLNITVISDIEEPFDAPPLAGRVADPLRLRGCKVANSVRLFIEFK